jgi:hypothetical protein
MRGARRTGRKPLALPNPLTEYLTYLSHVHEGAVGDMGFTLDDFKRYIAGPPPPRLTPRLAILAAFWFRGIDLLNRLPAVSAIVADRFNAVRFDV